MLIRPPGRCGNNFHNKPVMIDGSFWKNRRIFITGHTGFKGSWLCLWLNYLGASVCGYALEPQTNPNHFDLLDLDIASLIGDIRDREKLRNAILKFSPEIIFHLAAQPLVRYSFKDPVATFETNVMGTINVFEACRAADSVRAVVNITSDKCYENKEWVWGYRETDQMGGYDPYSASKGCAELATASFRNSFFNLNEYGKSHNVLLASARAGNVIGGGDWAEDRLVPDIARATAAKKRTIIRNPGATRPWQHVLEPLSGYLMLGQRLLEGKKVLAEGWNFGPEDLSNVCVEEIVSGIKKEWDMVEYEIQAGADRSAHEAELLKLDCSKAHARLKWTPIWNIKKTLEVTAHWYKAYYENGKINSLRDLEEYIRDANGKRRAY